PPPSSPSPYTTLFRSHLGRRIRLAVRRDLSDESVHHLEPDFLVRLLAAFEPQLDPHLMIVTKKLDGLIADQAAVQRPPKGAQGRDRKSKRLNSSNLVN